ncbi:MAG: DegT/DnrJ/EryC1/StrS family aminotransferase, partial [Planctomycetes bacterium]|nr:DegT/DnrJ/EryC1/StrS family aminotransferase [Planctomycetota bacterium]
DDVAGLAGALAAQDIQTRRFFYPLHLQPCYRYLNPPACVTSRRLYDIGLSLPSWCGLEAAVIDRICEAIIGYGVPA